MDSKRIIVCPDCGESELVGPDRREFLKTVGTTAAAACGVALAATPRSIAAPSLKCTSETAVKALYDTLTDAQKKAVCFEWDHMDKARGLLRTHVSNNWHITPQTIDGNFYTKEQKALAFEVFKGLFNPDWVAKIQKQLKDDTEGRAWGADQNLAIFGTPGTGKFMLVMTGRHMTIRADGDNEDHVALGGPIFHGHAASGFNEKVGHPGNIFWHQAVEANKIYQILDGKQQEKALVARMPAESAVAFRGPDGKYPGIPCAELSKDQKAGVHKTLMKLIEPYRTEDQAEIEACLKKMGGLDKCSLAFYKQGDLGDDNEWDNWRLEGPSFVWYFRGTPHVHIWINVASDPSVKLNARG